MTAFTRSLRSQRSDRFAITGLALALCVFALAGWGWWSVHTPITLYEVSDNVRIEVDRAVYPVQAPMLGKVAQTYLAVGKQVQAGDVLLEFDTSTERLQVREQEAHLATIAPEIDALRRQIDAEQRARVEEQRATGIAVEEARAQTRQAEVPARYNTLEEDRLNKLRAKGLIAQREYDRGHADAQQSRAAVDREQIVARRIEQEQRTRDSDRDTRIRKLAADITHLEGDATATRATVERLRNEIERRVVRAPVAGRLAEASTLRVGAVLYEGERVAAIVPDGQLLAVAQFPPPAALGRLSPGQQAQIRLQGFPWTQWGTVAATVQRVAGEVRGGTVQVEFVIDVAKTRIPLQHGLPGSVEVAVEKTTPAALVMRIAGRALASPRSSYRTGP